MKIGIPRACPKCSGRMEAISWDSVINILAPRSWHSCTECDFEELASNFTKELFTV